MNFADRLIRDQQRINTALSRVLNTLPFQELALTEAMKYGALLGGKRLRPFLVYATGEMLGACSESLDIPAVAVECIHAYSLIHDDLPAMDDDDLRRGQPTCHIKFSEDIAILAGDALQTLAFTVLAEAPVSQITATDRLAMISELARASGVSGMCGGQALDLLAEGRQTDLTTLELIHRHKTGALIRAAVRMGALAAGETGKKALPALDTYASAIGLAFQVQDDILDVIGDTIVLGKHQGADQSLGKSTYPALMGLDNARQKARELWQEAMGALDILDNQALDTSALRAMARYIIERDK